MQLKPQMSLVLLEAGLLKLRYDIIQRHQLVFFLHYYCSSDNLFDMSADYLLLQVCVCFVDASSFLTYVEVFISVHVCFHNDDSQCPYVPCSASISQHINRAAIARCPTHWVLCRLGGKASPVEVNNPYNCWLYVENYVFRLQISVHITQFMELFETISNQH